MAAKRASKRSRAGAAVATAVDEAAAVAAVENPFASTKKDGTSSMWKAEALDKLIDLLQREGFDGDYGELNRNHLPQFGEGTIRLFFNKLSRWKEPTETATAGEGGRAAATTSSSRARAAAKQQEATIDKIKYSFIFFFCQQSLLLISRFLFCLSTTGVSRGRGTRSNRMRHPSKSGSVWCRTKWTC